MSLWTGFLQSLFPSRYAVQTKSDGSASNLSSMLGAVGTALDSVDPGEIGLVNQFSVSAATGDALDKNGVDWGVARYAGEADDAYRARIKAVIPTYAQGPTLASLSAAVKPFTGTAPQINSAVQYSNLFPLTFPFQFGGTSTADYFTVHVYIQNPNHVAYRQQDVVAAVDAVKRVVATVILHWEDGTTTTVQ